MRTKRRAKKPSPSTSKRTQTILVVPDPHAHYQHENSRADLVSRLIDDLRPDCIVIMGDLFDMPSLSSYDKGKASAIGRTYAANIAAGREFDDRMWASFRRCQQRYKPRRVTLEGNHEYRLTRALEVQPELSPWMSFSDFGFDKHYTDVVRYSGQTPGTVEICGITFAHYLTSGSMARPIQSIHHAHNLLQKNHSSCCVAHSHLFDFKIAITSNGKPLTALVAGCFVSPDAFHDDAGTGERFWSRGIAVLRNVEDGAFDLEWISFEQLRRKYRG